MPSRLKFQPKLIFLSVERNRPDGRGSAVNPAPARPLGRRRGGSTIRNPGQCTVPGTGAIVAVMARPQTYVAFVRAVMVGREGLHRQVLVDAFSQSGATVPVSHITTGNVSFQADPLRLDELVAQAENRISAVVGRPTGVHVRSLDELNAMLAADPFADPPFDGVPSVAFFQDPVPGGVRLPLVSAAGDVSVFAAGNRELYAVSALVDGLSRGAGGMIEAAAGVQVTSRVWRTVTRIVDRLTTS